MSEFKQIVDHLAAMENDFDRVYSRAKEIRRNTSLLIAFVVLLITGLSLINLYILKELAHEGNQIVDNLTVMYQNFDSMSQQMTAIREHVENMNHNTQNMSVIHSEMSALQEKIAYIEGNMQTLNQTIQNMQQNIHVINQHTQTIAWQFQTTNQQVGSMQWDINEMADTLP